MVYDLIGDPFSELYAKTVHGQPGCGCAKLPLYEKRTSQGVMKRRDLGLHYANEASASDEFLLGSHYCRELLQRF